MISLKLNRVTFFHRDTAPSAIHHNKNSQFSYLALIRFIMAYIIYAGHYGLLARHEAFTYRLFQLGPFAAILVFLIISGYSIASSFNREMSGFYARRLGRIYPVFAVSLTFYVAFLAAYMSVDIFTADGTKHGPLPQVGRILINYLMLNGVIGDQIIGTSWSLAVEALFYITAPLLFLIVQSKKHILFLLLIIASAVFYWFHENLGLPYFANMSHGTAALALFFAWGCGFYFYFHQSAVWGITFPLFLCVLLNHYLPLGGKYSLYTLYIFSTLVFFANKLPMLNQWLTVLLNYLGEISYPLFILHYPLLIALNYQFHLSNQYVVTMVVLGVSALTLAFVDKPCRRWIATRSSLQVKNAFVASGIMSGAVAILCVISLFFYIHG